MTTQAGVPPGGALHPDVHVLFAGADRLAGREPPRLLYLSPLKALNYDVERNLRGPLAGIAAVGARLSRWSEARA